MSGWEKRSYLSLSSSTASGREKAAIKRYCISRERLELEVQWVLIRSVFRASAGALNENDSISGKPFVLRKQSPYRKR